MIMQSAIVALLALTAPLSADAGRSFKGMLAAVGDFQGFAAQPVVARSSGGTVLDASEVNYDESTRRLLVEKGDEKEEEMREEAAEEREKFEEKMSKPDDSDGGDDSNGGAVGDDGDGGGGDSDGGAVGDDGDSGDSGDDSAGSEEDGEPEGDPEADAPAAGGEEEPDTGADTSNDSDGECSILKRLSEEEDLSTFVETAKSLDDLGPSSEFEDLTILVPNNEAFSKIDKMALDELLADPAARDAVLELHIIPEIYTFEELSMESELMTIGGANITLSMTGDEKLMVAAPGVAGTYGYVTKTLESSCGNFIAHVLDGVLVPGEEEEELETLEDPGEEDPFGTAAAGGGGEPSTADDSADDMGSGDYSDMGSGDYSSDGDGDGGDGADMPAGDGGDTDYGSETDGADGADAPDYSADDGGSGDMGDAADYGSDDADYGGDSDADGEDEVDTRDAGGDAGDEAEDDMGGAVGDDSEDDAAGGDSEDGADDGGDGGDVGDDGMDMGEDMGDEEMGDDGEDDDMMASEEAGAVDDDTAADDDEDMEKDDEAEGPEADDDSFAIAGTDGSASGGSEDEPEPEMGDSGDETNKWPVCIPDGVEEKRFGGEFKFKDKPDGIIVYADGRCKLEEWAGGFDGFWSDNAGDSHEEELAEATIDMLKSKDPDAGVPEASAFLKELIQKTKPINLDHPKDEGRADGGVRQENIDKASKYCTEMITVSKC